MKIDRLYREPVDKSIDLFHRRYKPLRAWHRYEVQGMGHIPVSGRCLIVSHHSFATYDITLLATRVREVTGRVLRPLTDRAMFYFPVMGRYLRKIGNVPGDPVLGEELLEKEELVLVAPGGMREALRPFTERRKIVWDSRKGFVRLAIKTRTPVILSACPAADDIYTVYDSPLTKVIYNRLRLPVALVSGIGLTIVPRPLKLITYLSAPIDPPEVDVDDEKAFNEAVDQWHQELSEKMRALLDDHSG